MRKPLVKWLDETLLSVSTNYNHYNLRSIFSLGDLMKIGSLNIKGYAALAPMAGVADKAMRRLCKDFGAAYTVGELVSAKGVSMNDKKSYELLSVNECERPYASQLFGNEPYTMAKAAEKALDFNPDFIDINMGCPAPKVTANGAGSALMKDINLAASIVKEVVNAVNVPVTVKMRSGWDEDSINAVDLAKLCEQAGASAITVHARTRKQMYAPSADWQIIKKVKNAVKIPVIGNGDIDSVKAAKAMLEQTGCDFLMVGRAAMGAPWIFKNINAYLEDGVILPDPDVFERCEIMKEHIKLMLLYKDPHNALLEARKHTAWYTKGLRSAAQIRRMCSEINTFDDVERICEFIINENK